MAKLAGPGRMGSMKKMKESLKSKGNPFIRNIPAEGSLTGRFLDEPEDWFGFYEHWLTDGPIPCVEDDCTGCESDDPEERSRSFRYLANFYSVDDSKVVAVKLPKSLADQLTNYYEKFKGTLRDRDYDLSKSGSGKQGTKYMASPDAPSKMKLDRFKKLDLDDILQSLIDGVSPEEEEEKPKKKGKKNDSDPWEKEKSKKKGKSKKSEDDKPPTTKKIKKSSKPSSTKTIIRKKK